MYPNCRVFFLCGHKPLYMIETHIGFHSLNVYNPVKAMVLFPPLHCISFQRLSLHDVTTNLSINVFSPCKVSNPNLFVFHYSSLFPGHYLYVDSRSYYLRNDDRADLYSPLLQSSTQPRCLEFYYYMTGYNADFMVIYFAPWGESLSIDPQFSLYGDQGAEWKMAQVTIPPMDRNFQVL